MFKNIKKRHCQKKSDILKILFSQSAKMTVLHHNCFQQNTSLLLLQKILYR